MKILPFILTAFLMLASCRTEKMYVPVEGTRVELKTDSLDHLIRIMLEQSRRERETEFVFVRESNTVVINENGDTVKEITERDRDRSRETETSESRYLSVIDSLLRVTSRVDSVDRPVPYPVEVTREVNRLHWWQKALMWTGGVSAAVLVVALILAWKFKRK